jgi:hypothetical protein
MHSVLPAIGCFSAYDVTLHYGSQMFTRRTRDSKDLPKVSETQKRQHRHEYVFCMCLEQDYSIYIE